MELESTQHRGPAAAGDADWQAAVRDMVRHLRYGVVQIVVHDSRVVQIDRTERTRFDKRADGSPFREARE
jgi:hypothetical protein